MLTPLATPARPLSTSERASSNRVAVAILLAFAATAVMTLAPVWNGPGWPMNHETWGIAQRTQIYTSHWAGGDLLPIWSSTDNTGFGSPLPLFYHRLFYLVAAPLALAFGSLKAADAVAIVLALTAGAWGMFRLTRQMGANELGASVAGISLIAANYTVTNWLVRGAVAELTGAMLVPWVLLYFLRALTSRRMTVGLGVSLALMWHAHSVLAFYVGMLLAITFVVLALCRSASWTILDPRTSWPALTVFLVLVLPHLALLWLLQRGYDASRIISEPFAPWFQFRPISTYFWDTYWTPGHTEAGYTTQIDVPMLALLVVAVAAALKRRHDMSSFATMLVAVAIPTALCLALQTTWTDSFYRYMPGAAYIQFPWRLLAVLTPGLIAVTVVLADQALPHDKRLLALGACAAWMLAGSLAFAPLADGRVPVDPVSLANVSFSGFREYEPISSPPIADLKIAITRRWGEIGCTVTRDEPQEEVTLARFQVTCERAGVVPLPIYASVLHGVHTSGFDRTTPCLDVPDLPAVCAATVQAGVSVVDVQMPTLAGVARYLATLGRR
ncbi:MAG: hypothetical protein ABMA15_05600 [Vicinamibacterales bacterium]